jgi:hypothetical protein
MAVSGVNAPLNFAMGVRAIEQMTGFTLQVLSLP